MSKKTYPIIILCWLFFIHNGCTMYLKPKPHKLENYESNTNYNYYKYYSAEFEGQIGNKEEEMIHFGLNYLDSTYRIRIVNNDRVKPIEEIFHGKYSVNERGTVILHGDSPFLKNKYQIVTSNRKVQTAFLAEFKLNKKYSYMYGKKKKRAYCEINAPFELGECLNPQQQKHTYCPCRFF